MSPVKQRQEWRRSDLPPPLFASVAARGWLIRGHLLKGSQSPPLFGACIQGEGVSHIRAKGSVSLHPDIPLFNHSPSSSSSSRKISDEKHQNEFMSERQVSEPVVALFEARIGTWGVAAGLARFIVILNKFRKCLAPSLSRLMEGGSLKDGVCTPRRIET